MNEPQINRLSELLAAMRAHLGAARPGPYEPMLEEDETDGSYTSYIYGLRLPEAHTAPGDTVSGEQQPWHFVYTELTELGDDTIQLLVAARRYLGEVCDLAEGLIEENRRLHTELLDAEGRLADATAEVA